MAGNDPASLRGQDLTGARFELCDLSAAQFRNVRLVGARLVGAELNDVVLDGLIDGLVVNGVEVAPPVEAELDRRDPDRTRIHPRTADELRSAWELVTRRWDNAVDRARLLPPEALHTRVQGEWSFIETLRHLVF